MNWQRLICDKRLGMEEFHDPRTHIRSDFQRDYDRLIFSSPFRRLQNKTQVFPLPGSIFVHNRLTHSLEVSSVGRSMAREAWLLMRDHSRSPEEENALCHIPDIVATACLCHDLGNPLSDIPERRRSPHGSAKGTGRVLSLISQPSSGRIS